MIYYVYKLKYLGNSMKLFYTYFLQRFKLFIFFLIIANFPIISQEVNNLLSIEKIEKINNFVKKSISKSKIPGLSVVITSGDKTVYNHGFGYADIERQIPVDDETLFELGSTSKAFTGLGILYLKELGLLDLNDPISKYINWFTVSYQGKNPKIKLKHLLYQTSGIPFKTIGDIHESNTVTALEDTIRNIKGVELDHLPGEKFTYATINYDILGLIIENVTDKSFEFFMDQEVLKPLGLTYTYVNRESAYKEQEMAKGYKLGYLSPRAYSAPEYRGNTPAGYFISNSVDIAKWLKIQYNSKSLSPIYKNIIIDSHSPDNTVYPSINSSSYAAGWSVFQKGSGEISHGGNNPNFSSYFVIRPVDKIGVAVLANLNSSVTNIIGQGIMDIIQDKEVFENYEDMYQSLDVVSFSVLITSILFSLVILVQIIFLFIDFVKGGRSLKSFKPKNVISMFFSIFFLLCVAYCLYIIPNALFDGLPWNFVKVWGPVGFLLSLKLFYIGIVILSIYFQLIFYFPKNDEKPLFPLIVLSSISGCGNAFIIFTINRSLDNFGNFNISLITYFILGISLYIIGQKLISTKMVKIANNLVFEKRMDLINKILNSRFYKIETLEDGKIQAALNNDTEAISRAPRIIVSCFTSIITLIACFIYLGIINIYGLILTICTILIAVVIYTTVGNSANKLWEETRDIQNVFFKFVNDLIGGFKELTLNFNKKSDFIKDINGSCSEYRDKNISASLKFVNVTVLGELLFTIVIGVVAFIFPYIFKSIDAATIRTFIFIFLYMTGPINGVLHTIPAVLKIRVSWNRINDFIIEITGLSTGTGTSHIKDPTEKNLSLKLSGINYSYNSVGKDFKVGPINFEFKSGEITFITGGNGSGKTTLAKLITGLYKPDSGSVLINNNEIDHANLGEYFSHIFSDFYLFKKIYGINVSEKRSEIDEKLELLKIKDKVDIIDGEFSTLELSQGQRKRLALLLSYIDDKEIVLFDEWAADQDPEFRKFFYVTLIHELKERNKCVIAITHDDHYFHLADNIIKLDMGQME